MKQKIGIIMLLVTAMALMAAVACGSSATAPASTQPPPTETPVKGPPPPTETPTQGNPPPEEPAPVAVPAPIEDSSVVPPQSIGGAYTLDVTVGLPSGCAEFNEIEVERDGDRFVVTVTNLMPNPILTVACTAIYGYHDAAAVLGGGLTTGESYTVEINGEITHLFEAQDEQGLAMVEAESPIESSEVVETDEGYLLTVVSRLPKGSSCSRFNGYELNRRFANRIEVTVTHREVAEDNVPCTRDLPAVITEIPLGPDFEEGQTYTVSVNGTEITFPKDELATVSVPAPIEGLNVVATEEVGGAYVLQITTGLPSGCARFDGVEIARDGNHFVVNVTNLMPDPGEPIACTAIYGYHDSEVTLANGLEAGEAYIVLVNGEMEISFTAMDEAGLAMVEAESPIEYVEVAQTTGGYVLTVVSKLPKGSSCSRFNGYELNRGFTDRIEVTVTHREVAEDNVPCTADLPVVVTEIPLGDDFEAGRTYTVSVNGAETGFTAG